MNWIVVVPGALLSDTVADDAVRTRLARAERHPDLEFADTGDGAAAHWLWQRFGGTGTPALAPYAWHATRAAPPALQTWYCDPVHFAVARDHLVMSPLDAPLDAAETTTLLDAANAVARDSGATLHAPPAGARPAHWTLQFDRAWELTTTPLAAAAGRSIFELMPEGADATRWRKLLNDIQVEWHQLPTNEPRERRGALAVNAVWLHGGGTWSALPPARLSRVIAVDPAVRGWALASGVPADRVVDSPDSWNVASDPADAAAAGDTLIVDTSLIRAGTASPGARASAWSTLLDRVSSALDGHRHPGHRAPASIELLLAGERTIRPLTLRRSDGWRLWRRALPAESLVE